MGDKAYEIFGKEIEEEKKSEDILEKKIREIRKKRNKARLHPTKPANQTQKDEN